jgi:hypothetical protein
MAGQSEKKKENGEPSGSRSSHRGWMVHGASILLEAGDRLMTAA